MQITTIRYPGRPELTFASGLGSVLLYTGLVTGVLSLRVVIDHPDLWWITASLGAMALAGFGIVRLVHRHFERTRPRTMQVTMDAATYAALRRALAEQPRDR